MRKIRKPFPPKTPKYQVGIGKCDGEFHVGIYPQISDELLKSAGGEAIKSWVVEDALRKTTGATVLKSTVEVTEEEVRGTGVTLALGITREIGFSTPLFCGVVEMAPGTAPFLSAQPKS